MGRALHCILASVLLRVPPLTFPSLPIIIIFGVVPLRGFPLGRRGIGCRVPILGGRRITGPVRLVGRACPSRGCQTGMAVQLVGPAPSPHGALGGRQAFAGCGPATDASASAQPSEGRTKEWWLPLDTTSRCCDVVAGS